MKKIMFILLLLTSCLSFADSNLKIITLGASGSQSDTAIRFFAPMIEKETNKNVIIQNIPGANGLIGIRDFLRLPKDQPSMIIGNSNLAYLSQTTKGLEFDPLNDLEPVYGLADSPILILVSSTSKVNNLKDLVELYHSKNRLLGGSASALSTIMINGLSESIGVNTEIVNYKLSQEMAMNTATGLIDYFTAAAGNSSAQSLLDAGKLKVIGVISHERSISYPFVKTVQEQGYSEVHGFSWVAFFVNKDLPTKMKQDLRIAIEKALRTPEAYGYENLSGNPRRWLASWLTVRIKQLQELQYLR